MSRQVCADETSLNPCIFEYVYSHDRIPLSTASQSIKHASEWGLSRQQDSTRMVRPRYRRRYPSSGYESVSRDSDGAPPWRKVPGRVH